MRVNTGRGWVDLGPTAQVKSTLPKGVRLPYRANNISQFTGGRYVYADSDLCHIDKEPSVLGTDAGEDRRDRSRHGGLSHVWTAQPNAIQKAGSRPGDHNSPLVRGEQWVVDPRDRYGYRRIDIELVTLPHDCDNHLPEGE